MKHGITRLTTRLIGHPKDNVYQCGIGMRWQTPTDNPEYKKIHNNRQLALAISWPAIRNISTPYPVCLRYNELTLEQIRETGMLLSFILTQTWKADLGRTTSMAFIVLPLKKSTQYKCDSLRWGKYVYCITTVGHLSLLAANGWAAGIIRGGAYCWRWPG